MATPLLPVSVKLEHGAESEEQGLKIEDGAESEEQNVNASTNEMSSSSTRTSQAAGEAASHSMQNVLLTPEASWNDGSLLALPPEKAVLSSYPPGCPVLHIDVSEAPPLITFGVVCAVSIDLTSRLFVYRVAATGTGNAIVTAESQLQWAPSCRVWMCLPANGTENSVWKPAIVLSAYQPSPQSPPLFSLQEDGASGALFHGVPKQCIRYRTASSVTPAGSPLGFATPIVNNEEPVSLGPVATPVLQGPVVNEEPVSHAYRRLSLVSNHSTQSPVLQGPVVNEEPVSHACRRLSLVSNHSTQSLASETVSIVSSLQVGSSKEDPAIGFAPAVNHEDPASRASHGLSVANNHLMQSRRSEVAAACSTPAVRRPNDAEIEQPPAKRVKTNEGRPSARKSAENSEEVTNPLGSVVQLRSDNETMANQDISATRRRNKNRATVAEKDSVNDGSHEQDLVTFDFFIPGSEFDLVTINDFVRKNGKKINRETNCTICLKSNRHKAIYIQLRGTRDQIRPAQHAVERYLVDLVDEKEKGRVLYFVALLNSHRIKHGKVVYQYCYHHEKPGMKYMLCQMLPRDCQEIIGYVIGKKGRRKKDLEKETMCKIEINVDCDKPHFVVYGNAVTDVRECGKLVHELLKQSRQLRQQQGCHM